MFWFTYLLPLGYTQRITKRREGGNKDGDRRNGPDERNGNYGVGFDRIHAVHAEDNNLEWAARIKDTSDRGKKSRLLIYSSLGRGAAFMAALFFVFLHEIIAWLSFKVVVLLIDTRLLLLMPSGAAVPGN